MIKAILFDLDGTLLDRDTSLLLFIEAQYERLRDVLGHIPKEHYIARFIELDNRGYVWKDTVYAQLVAEFHISSTTSKALLEDYVANFQHHCVAFPHVHDMLDELKRHQIVLGMITNGYGQFQMDNIKALGIEAYFDVILVSEWEGMKKPDPNIFKKALQLLQVVPSESLFIGDHPENDIAAAQAIGMKVIWKQHEQWTDVKADAVIDDYEELVRLLAQFDTYTY